MLVVVIALLQIFFLQGRFIFGPDVRSLGLTIFLIVAPVAVFCVFVARKLMDVYSNHWGVSIMVVSVVFTIYVSSLLLHTYSIYYFLLHFFLLFSNVVDVLTFNKDQFALEFFVLIKDKFQVCLESPFGIKISVNVATACGVAAFSSQDA